MVDSSIEMIAYEDSVAADGQSMVDVAVTVMKRTLKVREEQTSIESVTLSIVV